MAKYSFNPDKKHCKYFIPSVVQSMYTKTVKVDETSDGKPIYATNVVSDVSLLFNQKRLQQTLGVDTIRAWLDGIDLNTNSSLRELKSKVSDEQMLSLVKSRYIQSPSELLAWSEFLNDNYEGILQAEQSDGSPSDGSPSDGSPSDGSPSDGSPSDGSPS